MTIYLQWSTAYSCGKSEFGKSRMSNSKDMIPILPARLDWPSAIGNFLINFGMQDWLVLVFLEDRTPSERFAKIKNEHFQDRIVRIKKIVERRHRLWSTE